MVPEHAGAQTVGGGGAPPAGAPTARCGGARGGGDRRRGYGGDGLGRPKMGLPAFPFFKFFLLTEAVTKTVSVNIRLTVTVDPRRLRKPPRLIFFARLG